MFSAILETIQQIPPAIAIAVVGIFTVWHHMDDRKQREKLKKAVVDKTWINLFKEDLYIRLDRIERKIDKNGDSHKDTQRD